MMFTSEQQRDAFARACRGSHKHHTVLSAELRAFALRGMVLHNRRAARKGRDQDPLRIRERWDGIELCRDTPEARSAATILRRPGPKCKCRRCRLLRAARRMVALREQRIIAWRDGARPTGAAYSWRDIWAEVPEAALAGGPLCI